MERPQPIPFRDLINGVSLRKVVTRGTSLTGWGAVFQDRSINGHWTPQLRMLHINQLEAVFLAMKHFLPHLEDFTYWSDKTT